MGIHAASDTEYDWPWYGQLVGAYFDSHPNNPNVRMARLEVVKTDHPSTAHLSSTWERDDEWYNFRDFNPDIEVLINLDEDSYEAGLMENSIPLHGFTYMTVAGFSTQGVVIRAIPSMNLISSNIFLEA